MTDEVESLLKGYHGDEPYPDDDHSLGEHEEDPDPACRECRKVLRRRRRDDEED